MKRIKPLSDLECRRLKAAPDARTPPRLRDGGGLFLEALPTGRKVWRMSYRTAGGRRNTATFGEYPTVTLSEARRRRDETREALRQGVDANQAHADSRRAMADEQEATFAVSAKEWIDHKVPTWSEGQASKVRSIVARYLLPWLGRRPISAITPAEMLKVLQRPEKLGKLESAHRAREYASAIFRRAMLTGVATANPADALRGALRPKQVRNLAHLTDPNEVGELLRAIDGFTGSLPVRAALQILPRVFLRPGELRTLLWRDVDLDSAVVTIPPERMKMRRPHRVPLATQVVGLFEDLARITRRGNDSLVFPGARSRLRPISENTLNAGLRRLGYDHDQATAHGFRHTASTLLHEQGWPSHVIETQLAHKDLNAIRATYNKAEYWDDRVRMMQAWADYLDDLSDPGRSRGR